MKAPILVACGILVLAAPLAEARGRHGGSGSGAYRRASQPVVRPAAPVARRSSPVMRISGGTAARTAPVRQVRGPVRTGTTGSGFAPSAGSRSSRSRGSSFRENTRLNGSHENFMPMTLSRPAVRRMARRAEAPAEPVPDPHAKTGAWIRTAGMGYSVASGGPVRTHSTDAGDGFINQPVPGGLALGGAGITQGAPDSSTVSSGNSLTGNTGITVKE